jgi:MFS family permease
MTKTSSGLGPRSGAWLVFFATGSVLVLEILSLRLVAPYLGLTLETSTAVIGFALAAIAVGAWLGGRTADVISPERLLGPTMLVAGVLVLFVGPIVRWTGEQVRGGDVSAVLLMAAVAVFAPAALLSAISPMVVKLRLESLAETGTVVGGLSGVGTLGALVATFGTGFVLVAAMPTSTILLVLGIALVILGVVLAIRLRGMSAALLPLVVAVLGVVASFSIPEPCDVETAYHCARVVPDPIRDTGRTLQLDTLPHSYVDLADPTYLQYSYIRAFASVVDAVRAPGEALSALHLGGGGLTFPRYLAETRPGADSLVLEIDGGVIDLDVAELGLRLGRGIQVDVQDARVGLAAQPARRRDVVVGDAFGGLAVPWHLTTRETVADIRRVLRPDGLYMVNVIDYPPLSFARAKVATVAALFRHVAVVARPSVLDGQDGGNLVIVGSNRPLPTDAIGAQLQSRAPELDLFFREGQITSFAGGARVLTDDFAPVDQLVTPFAKRS